jgi:excisionase family DNA binding protein
LTIFLGKIILLFVAREMKILSVAEAAEKLGVTRRRVNQLIDKNRLPAQRVGRAFVIREDDLRLVENRQTGRPPKVKVNDKEDLDT